ncbi:hypothetical protein EXU57_01155 [Segetibacter sp. 3557_3]|uniref:hypothetical protein n=1 Tax=Segetibacter sp. 3557_3 TaxID=2547429 RepID=UPI001058C756|nr:hypothetical protein [Segetibacter sp. 3557_3]TDH28714.1 hypothetical protein EXU57_01155 [Segetibacter sp. 3557_3]
MFKLCSTTFFVVYLLTISSTTFAKIWRVNNNSGIAADFTTLTNAHNGAAAGDTLHVEGSPNSYGSLTATKRLIIIGPGYYLSQNENTQALKLTARVDGITVNTGASGTQIMGMDFNGYSVSVFANDVVIKRNRFSSTNGANMDWVAGLINTYYTNNSSNLPANNIIISQNYGVRIDINYPSTGVLITNNYLLYGTGYGDNTTGAALGMHANAIAIIQNNVIRNGKLAINNSSFTNNIMVAGSFDGAGNLISNNLASGTQFGTENNNRANVDMSSVFIGAGANVSPDQQWRLKAGSPAIGAGFGSTAQNPVDAGMFSGHTPYVLAGLPPVPTIYFFENKPVGSDTDPITVTIKVKSVGN